MEYARSPAFPRADSIRSASDACTKRDMETTRRFKQHLEGSLFPELERLHRPQPADLARHPLERPTMFVALRKHRQPRETHPLLRRRKLEQLRAQTVEIAPALVHRQRLATEPLDQIRSQQVEREQRAVPATAAAEQLALRKVREHRR